MYRFVSFIIIFSVVGVMLYLHQSSSHSFATNSHATMHNQPITIPDQHNVVPTITGSLTQDSSGSWLLKIDTTHFTFTPEKIGSSSSGFHEGHAHLYINGEKINRIYGNYYNIQELKQGANTIKVTLNGNNHNPLFYKGKEIAFQQTIKVS